MVLEHVSMRAHRRGHGSPHQQVQALAAPSPSDPLHVCSLTLLQQGASLNAPVHTQDSCDPILSIQHTAQQPLGIGDSERSLVPKKWKEVGAKYPHQECPPFPQSHSMLERGRTGSTHVHRQLPLSHMQSWLSLVLSPSHTLSICNLLYHYIADPWLSLPLFAGLFHFLLPLHTPL